MNALVRLSDETSTIAADGLLKSEVKRIGDEGVSDRDFGEEGDSFGEETQVVQAQVMPCIELQPQGTCAQQPGQRERQHGHDQQDSP